MRGTRHRGLRRPRPPGRIRAWREHGQQVRFFLEYDSGTETLYRLLAKLTDYRDVADAGSCPASVGPSVLDQHSQINLSQNQS